MSPQADPISSTGGIWDWVYGSNGSIYLNGAQASVTGNSDTLVFSGSSNTATVSGGSENFVFDPAFGQDVINGYTSTDTMQFSASDFVNWSDLLSHASQVGADTVITRDANDTATLTNVALSCLQQSQFTFA